jgi:hypothetical protein
LNEEIREVFEGLFLQHILLMLEENKEETDRLIVPTILTKSPIHTNMIGEM